MQKDSKALEQANQTNKQTNKQTNNQTNKNTTPTNKKHDQAATKASSIFRVKMQKEVKHYALRLSASCVLP